MALIKHIRALNPYSRFHLSFNLGYPNVDVENRRYVFNR